MKGIRDWLIATYNGLYRIVLQPYMPSRKTLILLVVGYIIGLLASYALFPVQFYNADPHTLSEGYRHEWVNLLAERYEYNTAVAVPSDEFNTQIINQLSQVENPLETAQSLGIGNPDFLALAEQANPGKAAPDPSNLWASLSPWIIGPIVIVVLAVILWLVWGLLIYGNLVEPIIKKIRGGSEISDQGTQTTIDALRRAKQAEEQAKERAANATTAGTQQQEPGTRIIHKASVYLQGRGSYDDSFEIENEDKRFFGECGSTIAETIGEGSPEKVTAVEVWLFDKEDFVRTLTNVFVSEYAYNDPAIRSKLETKGNLILAQPQATTRLETKTLIMQATIVDMTYGTGTMPPNSYFENMTVEIVVWHKGDGATNPVYAATVPVAAAPVASDLPPLPSMDMEFDPPPPMPSYMQQPQQVPPAAPVQQPPQQQQPYVPPQPPVQPYTPPQPVPQQPYIPEPPRRDDDDPFGGTGDFTPINR